MWQQVPSGGPFSLAGDKPHQRFHDLRHACASLLLAQGVNPRVVMEILGHSQITLTLDTYSHVMPSVQAEALAGLSVMLADRSQST